MSKNLILKILNNSFSHFESIQNENREIRKKVQEMSLKIKESEIRELQLTSKIEPLL